MSWTTRRAASTRFAFVAATSAVDRCFCRGSGASGSGAGVGSSPTVRMARTLSRALIAAVTSSRLITIPLIDIEDAMAHQSLMKILLQYAERPRWEGDAGHPGTRLRQRSRVQRHSSCLAHADHLPFVGCGVRCHRCRESMLAANPNLHRMMRHRARLCQPSIRQSFNRQRLRQTRLDYFASMAYHFEYEQAVSSQARHHHQPAR